jgi:hypothetical protein
MQTISERYSLMLTLFLRSLGWRPDRKRSKCARPRRSCLPQLLALEDRTVPSTFTVTSLADSGTGTLRAGVASGADTIRFAPGLHGTIPLTSEIAITSTLTIDGPGAAKITVSGTNSTRVFKVSGASTHLSINELTIANGRAATAGPAAFGGGLLNDGADVSLSKVVFASNQAGDGTSYAGGGAIANLGKAHLTTDQTDFVGNVARGAATDFGNGGAIYDDQNSVVSVDHATFSGNMVTAGNANGGAIANYGGSQLTLDHSTFAGNQAFALPPGSALAFGAFGGAIQSDQDESGFFGDLGQPTMTIDHSSFTNNLSHVATPTDGSDGGTAAGGAIELEDNAKATVSHSTFASNQAVGGDGGAGSAGNDGGFGGTAAGGAVAASSAVLDVSNSQFNGNAALAGTGGQGGAGGNGSPGGLGQGGAVIVSFSTVTFQPPQTTIANCQFVGNQAIGGDGGAGGAGGNGGPGSFADGGGILHRLGTIDVSNCTIAGNTARGGAGGAAGSGGIGGDGGLGRGGGFSNERGGTATLSHVSIVNNQAVGGAGAAGGNGGNAVGGGVYNGRFTNQAATLELSQCTVSGNLVKGGAGGAGGNGGFALGGGIFNGNTTATGDLITTDPYPTVDLDGTNVTGNQAVGGAAGSGGVAGVGQGGGLYNQSGAVAELDAHSKVKGNKASTSDDDVFGSVTLT